MINLSIVDQTGLDGLRIDGEPVTNVTPCQCGCQGYWVNGGVFLASKDGTTHPLANANFTMTEVGAYPWDDSFYPDMAEANMPPPPLPTFAQAFFMVSKTNGGGSTFRHPTYGEALKEAERLASINPNSEFVILQSIKAVKSSVALSYDEHLA